MIPKSQEGEVKRIKMMLADLFAMSQKNGGFVLIMAKDGKGNVRSAMTMNSVSSAEGLAFAIDAEFKMKALIKSVAEQAMSGGINELMKQMDDTRKAEDKSVG